MYYPLMVDLSARKILIVGGGNIGYRKAHSLLQYGPHIEVLSKEIDDRFYELEGISVILDQYDESYLEGAFLVFGATSSKEVNSKIASDCRKRNILFNNVSLSGQSNFISPSIYGNENFLIATSTMGKFPFLSKYLKEIFEIEYSRFNSQYILLLEESRSIILDHHRENMDLFFRYMVKLDYDELLNFVERLKDNTIELEELK